MYFCFTLVNAPFILACSVAQMFVDGEKCSFYIYTRPWQSAVVELLLKYFYNCDIIES